jgi:hypothetical protein
MKWKGFSVFESINVDLAIKDDVFKQRNQQYTYSEVQNITNNFTMVIGKGGFGTVFRGSIEGNQVAVKILSESSAQGYKEFQAEVSWVIAEKAFQFKMIELKRYYKLLRYKLFSNYC